MLIRDMFKRDIKRPINGVIQVGQDTEQVIGQEIEEYVITKELKKHFMTFFNHYSDALDTPTSDTGVWISGFFGSGKSHFLKMLSYLLENKRIYGKSTVDCFRDKFEDDPATFMLIDRASKVETETILFNIEVESPNEKGKAAVLRVFAKMFYSHRGFYGENLKVAMLEDYIEREGKTEAFRQAFEEEKGKPWLECRRSFAFNKKSVVSAMVKALNMSQEDAKSWCDDKSDVTFSISQFVQNINDYLKTKPEHFRLLFMVDEVGQYVGTDTGMLLNLQSLVEEIGSKCGGKVWVVCTGQEAIDEIIKVRADEFSRIQARFKTRMSLSSSSVDEVIQKRVLKKTEDAENILESVYEQESSVLRNLFTFSNARLDLKGYQSSSEFAANYPFIPYQMIVMQKVFVELRKHGNAGQHFSGGERSMISGFQEAAQKISDKDEHSLVPFYLFYDTLASFLDSTIRNVIDRCQNAADNHDGIEPIDVNVLKMLYLIRYIDDIPSKLENIMILMADNINMDKPVMRKTIQASLDRLMNQNYISHSGDLYHFLTDEEQDIQREIRDCRVDTSEIIKRISDFIYSDIFTTKKFTYRDHNFGFNQFVDDAVYGNMNNEMNLRFLTVATDPENKAPMRLIDLSKHREALVVLDDVPYYEVLENVLKIRKYIHQKNIHQLPKSTQNIIQGYADLAAKQESEAKALLLKAIENADFYADGESLNLKSGTAINKINQTIEYLVSHLYSELDLIGASAENDMDILNILKGRNPVDSGNDPNAEAEEKVIEYLLMQTQQNLPTSMNDIQDRYQKLPYGWENIDIAVVMARLIESKRVVIKYSGTIINADNAKLPDMLRKKTEIGRTMVSIRENIPLNEIREVRQFLRDFFELMDVPSDEDNLISFILDHFSNLKKHYEELQSKYVGHNYPDAKILPEAIAAIDTVLTQKKDNRTLVETILNEQDHLFDSQERMQRVENFFRNQVQIFDAAVALEEEIYHDRSYLAKKPAVEDALNKIRLITQVQKDAATIYKNIPELNGLMDTVKVGHDELVKEKQAEIKEIVRQCLADIHTAAESPDCRQFVENADHFFSKKRDEIEHLESLALLDGLTPPMWSYRDDLLKRIEAANCPKPVMTQPDVFDEEDESDEMDELPKSRKKVIKKAYRQSFPAKTLESVDDVDHYLKLLRDYLLNLLQDCDGIDLN